MLACMFRFLWLDGELVEDRIPRTVAALFLHLLFREGADSIEIRCLREYLSLFGIAGENERQGIMSHLDARR